MKQFIITTGLLMLICISPVLKAQNFHVLDINKSTNSNITNNSIFGGLFWYDYAYATNSYAVLNGVSYFAATDGINGSELWRSDGTDGGTWLVKDINSDNASSQVHDITVSGGKIYFSANDGTHGFEIWASDGTKQGTRMLKDIYPGIASSSPSYLTDVNGILYFFTNYASSADQLWKTDGTKEGTEKVANFYTPRFGFGGYGRQLTNVDGRVFFTLSTNGDTELWATDGTKDGAYLVKDINPYFNSSYPSYLTALNGKLYFSADDGNTGRQLWISDGTESGTYKVNNYTNINIENNTLLKFTIKGNSLYFTGYLNDGNGAELCKYDASNPSNTVEVVKVINPGYYSYNLYNITNVNGTIFFTVYNGIDQVLWKSNGKTQGTEQVKNINPGGRNIYWYKNFVNANGMLLFSFYDDIRGSELWKSDGTEAGTIVVKEIFSGVSDPQAVDITYLGNSISIFQANDGKSGLELWRTNGTSEGTNLVKDINRSATASSDPYLLTPGPDSSKLFFVASDYKYGTELRVTDGFSGTQIVKDIFKGSFGSYPYNVISSGKATYFFAQILDTNKQTTSDVRTLQRMFVSDGTSAGTKILSVPLLESLINGNGYVYAIDATFDLLYMLVFNYATNQLELWRSDGTSEGTYAVKTDILSYYEIHTKAVDNILFFTNYDFTYGNELWKSDGTIGGTTLVKDIFPGFDNSSPEDLTAFNGKLYFAAVNDYSGISYLWSSDGTKLGTRLIKRVPVAYYIPFTATKKKLFFYSTDYTRGEELWVSDGTREGTTLTRDIWPGISSSYFYLNPTPVGVDSLLYFVANDGVHGAQLWRSNGTFSGTKMVKDLGENAGYLLSDFVNANGHFYFLNNGALWKSDCTDEGTIAVNDASLTGVTGLAQLKAFSDKLVFTAYEPSTGKELYARTIESSSFAKASKEETVQKTHNAFNAVLYPNPSHGKTELRLTRSIKNMAVLVTDMSGKTIWQSNYSNPSRIILPTEKLAAGSYVVTIKSANGSMSLSLVKE